MGLEVEVEPGQVGPDAQRLRRIVGISPDTWRMAATRLAGPGQPPGPDRAPHHLRPA